MEEGRVASSKETVHSKVEYGTWGRGFTEGVSFSSRTCRHLESCIFQMPPTYTVRLLSLLYPRGCLDSISHLLESDLSFDVQISTRLLQWKSKSTRSEDGEIVTSPSHAVRTFAAKNTCILGPETD